MDRKYYIILSWNYKNQQDQQNFDLAPMRYRSKDAAALCAQEIVNAELSLFAEVNEIGTGTCKIEKDGERDLWTISVADGSKPWTFRVEVVECAA